CHDELVTLNRSMGHLLGRPDLETDGNPLAPAAVVDAFAGALRAVDFEDKIKFTILKELNQSSLGDLNAIYADVNRHLNNLHVVPPPPRPQTVNLEYVSASRAKRGAAARAARAAGKSAMAAEVDVMALFRKMFQQEPPAPAPFGGAGVFPGVVAPMPG